MKFPLFSQFLLGLALIGVATADLPKKAPPGRYSGLWNNSPFTSKPPPPPDAPENNILDDYSLIGIAPIGGTGYRVTMINKKKPEDRITVDSGSTKTDFRIVGVTPKPGNPLGTVVAMTYRSMPGTVAFDEKLLTIAASPAAPKGAPPQPGQPPQPPQPVQPGQPNLPGGLASRQPRPRIVPPPTPQATKIPPRPTTTQPVQQNSHFQRPQHHGN